MRLFALVLLVACSSTPAKPQQPAKPVPSCVDTANHMLDLLGPKDDHAHRIREIFAERCKQDEWPAEAKVCVMETTSLKDPKGCKLKLTLEQRESLERDLADADRLARVGKLPPACERYKLRIEKLVTCDKLPQQARDALKQGFDAMSQGWVNLEHMPPEALAAMAHACQQGTEALEMAVKDLCGW